MTEKKVQLQEGETVLVTIRRHWFNLFVEAFAAITLFVFVASCVIFLDVLLAGISSDTGAHSILPLGFFVLGLVGLLLWMRFFARWSDHWLDAWIITNERVIDIEQKGFFAREVSSFPLNRIQDVTFTVTGIIPTWLHFGDVRIQTASISEDFIMKQVPFPEEIKEQLVSILHRVNH